MKHSLGAKTLIFPTPTWIVGSYDAQGKPNGMTAAWGGICCSEPPCVAVSLRKATYSYGNLWSAGPSPSACPAQGQVKQADYFGLVSGRDTDKFAATGWTPVRSDLVDAPYVQECPLVLECKVLHVFELGLHTQFVGQILDVKADEEVLDAAGMPDMEKVPTDRLLARQPGVLRGQRLAGPRLRGGQGDLTGSQGEQSDHGRFDKTGKNGQGGMGVMEFEGFRPTLFEFLEELAANNNRPWFQENKGRYERDVLEPCAGLHPRLPAPAEADLAVLRGQRPAGGRLAHAGLPRHAVLQARRAVQDQRRHPVPARVRPRHPCPGLLRPHRAGRVLPGRGRVAARPLSLGQIRQAIVEWPDRWRRATETGSSASASPWTAAA